MVPAMEQDGIRRRVRACASVPERTYGIDPDVRSSRMPRRAPQIDLTSEEKLELERFSRGRTTPARLVVRAKIVLAAAEGKTSQAIADELDLGRKTVNLWRHRFVEARIAGIVKGRAPRCSTRLAGGQGARGPREDRWRNAPQRNALVGSDHGAGRRNQSQLRCSGSGANMGSSRTR